MEAKLIVVGGDVKTTEIKLKLPCSIGRGRGTTLMLPHPLVSRQHCEIYEHEGQLVVKDLGSLNGTYINNTRLTEPTLLPSGDLLTVGTVTFRAEYAVDPNLAPPDAGARTVRGAETKPASKTMTPASSDTPDFTTFDEEEIEEVAEMEEVDETPPPAKPGSKPTASGGDDFDIMSMLDDEVEEVIEAPQKPAPKAKAPEKPASADKRWQAPAADANETVRANATAEKAQPKPAPPAKQEPKAEANGHDDAALFLAGLGLADAPAEVPELIEEVEVEAETPVASTDDPLDFLATLGLDDAPAPAAESVEELPIEEVSDEIEVAEIEEVAEVDEEFLTFDEPAAEGLAENTPFDEVAEITDVEEIEEIAAPEDAAGSEELVSEAIVPLEETPVEPEAVAEVEFDAFLPEAVEEIEVVDEELIAFDMEPLSEEPAMEEVAETPLRVEPTAAPGMFDFLTASEPAVAAAPVEEPETEQPVATTPADEPVVLPPLHDESFDAIEIDEVEEMEDLVLEEAEPDVEMPVASTPADEPVVLSPPEEEMFAAFEDGVVDEIAGDEIAVEDAAPIAEETITEEPQASLPTDEPVVIAPPDSDDSLLALTADDVEEIELDLDEITFDTDDGTESAWQPNELPTEAELPIEEAAPIADLLPETVAFEPEPEVIAAPEAVDAFDFDAMVDEAIAAPVPAAEPQFVEEVTAADSMEIDAVEIDEVEMEEVDAVEADSVVIEEAALDEMQIEEVAIEEMDVLDMLEEPPTELPTPAVEEPWLPEAVAFEPTPAPEAIAPLAMPLPFAQPVAAPEPPPAPVEPVAPPTPPVGVARRPHAAPRPRGTLPLAKPTTPVSPPPAAPVPSAPEPEPPAAVEPPQPPSPADEDLDDFLNNLK